MIPNHSRSKSTSIDEEVFENAEANGNASVEIERKSTTTRLELTLNPVGLGHECLLKIKIIKVQADN